VEISGSGVENELMSRNMEKKQLFRASQYENTMWPRATQIKTYGFSQNHQNGLECCTREPLLNTTLWLKQGYVNNCQAGVVGATITI
jgi:hypothetical protein